MKDISDESEDGEELTFGDIIDMLIACAEKKQFMINNSKSVLFKLEDRFPNTYTNEFDHEFLKVSNFKYLRYINFLLIVQSGFSCRGI